MRRKDHAQQVKQVEVQPEIRRYRRELHTSRRFALVSDLRQIIDDSHLIIYTTLHLNVMNVCKQMCNENGTHI